MNKLILPFLLGVIIAAIPASTHAQLVVTPSTPAGLVNRLVNATGGVVPTNITMNGAAATSYGEFNCTGPCNLGMPGGILLTSGTATLAVPPNAISSHGSGNGGGSDPQLVSLLPITVPPTPINDACVLEFDFWAQTDIIEFDYRFASEEYNEWVAGYNDVFGFFINGPGITGTQNIAVLPGTSTPVSIFNINNGINNPATGPCVNCAYYVDNSTAPFAVTTAYDGITTKLTATADVCPCEIYHIKLAVGDASDFGWDSGVFLEENSFNSVGQINVYADGVAQPDNNTYYACAGSSVTLSVLPNLTCTSTIFGWSNGATTNSIVVTQANVGSGTFAALVTHPTNGQCFGFTTFLNVVFINPADSIGISGNTAICPGGTTTLTAAPTNAPNFPVTYQWSNGQTTQSINVGAGTYTVTATMLQGCTASVTQTVTVGTPTATITPSGPTNLCTGGSVTLTANPGTSYLWSDGSTSQSITVNQTGSYSVTVTHSGGCSATSNVVNVTVSPGLTPAITGNTTICQGSITTLNAGSGYSSYQWSGGMGATQNVNVSIAGTFTVTVTDAAGCTGSASITTTVNPLPTAAITGNTSICTGSTSTLDAGAGYTNYLWSAGLGSGQTASVNTSGTYNVTVTDANGCTATASATVTVGTATATITPSGSTALCIGDNVTLTANSGTNYQWSTGDLTQSITVTQSGNYTVTVTQTGGCSATSTAVAVTVNPLPTPAITGNTAICQGSTTILDAGAGYSSYQWSPSGSNQTVSAGTAGSYSVIVTDANGCTGSSSVNLTVNPLPTPTITGINSICQGATTTLDAGAGFNSYLWSNSAGASQTATVNASANYQVTVTDANGCTGVANMNVTVNPLPTASITGNTNICQGETTILDAGAGFVSYLWSGGLGSGQTASTGTSGSYSVTVTDANGCSNSTSSAVIVNTLPTPSITGNTAICQGSTSILDAGAGYSSYQWSPSGSNQTVSAGTSGSYSVIVTDANGCTGSSSVNLTVNPLPVPTITGINSICQGETTTLDAGAGFSSYLWSNSAGTSQTAIVNSSANYQVTVTDANGCTGVTNMNVTVNPLPTPTITGNTNICQGASTILDAGAGYSAYQWLGTITNQTLTTSTSGSYQVTVTDANGCTGTASVSVTVNALPTPSITGNTTICQGSTTTFDAGASFSSYQWSTSGSGQTISPGTAGSYTVTVTDANGCTGSASTTLTVNTASASITAQGPTTFCQGDNVVLTANSGTGYLWSNGAITQNITVNSSGTYTVSVTSANGCTAISTSITTTESIPVANAVAQSSTTLCPGDNVTITANSGSSYLWSNGDITQSIIVNQAGNYTVTVTNSDGCLATSNVVAVTESQPVATITPLGSTTFCDGQDVELEANVGLSYLWSTGATSRSIIVTTPGSYTVTVTNTDNCAAISSPEQVTVNTATASITAIGSTTFCPGDNVVLEANQGQSYLWSNGAQTQSVTVSLTGNYTVTVVNNNGCTATSSALATTVSIPQSVITPASSTTICPGSTVTLTANPGSSYLWSTGEQTQSIQAAQAGNYTVIVTNNDGCDTISLPVEVLIDVPVAVATAQGPTNFCVGDNVIISANAGSAYLWSTGETTQSITATAAGTYTVTVTNSTGCTETSNNIIVTTMTAVASITTMGPTIFCPGGDVTLEANPGLAYTWSTGETSQSITVSNEGSYTVNVVNTNGCDATSAPVQVTVSPNPQISFTADKVGGCDPFTPRFINNTVTDNQATYFWDFGDGSTSTAINPSHLYSGIGLYTVTLQVTSGFGCYAELTFPDMITVSESPVADFMFLNENGGGTEPLQFNSTIRFVDQSIDASHWIWSFGDGFSSNEQHPLHTYSDAGEFTIRLTVLNQYNCPASKEAQILVTPFFMLPNAFTPDGDGMNDEFIHIPFEMNVAAFELQVFNKWGEKIFQSNDPRKTWRGEGRKGNQSPEGVYVYKLMVKDYNDRDHEFMGTITLIR